MVICIFARFNYRIVVVVIRNFSKGDVPVCVNLETILYVVAKWPCNTITASRYFTAFAPIYFFFEFFGIGEDHQIKWLGQIRVYLVEVAPVEGIGTKVFQRRR